VKRLFLVLVLVVMAFGAIPTETQAYALGRITNLSTQTMFQVEFPEARPGIIFRIKTADGQVTDVFREIVGYPAYHVSWVDLPNQKVEVGFYEPTISKSDSLWQDANGDGWFSWQGARLEAISSCRNGYSHVLVQGDNLNGKDTWLLVYGNGIDGWPVMFNGSHSGDYAYGTYQGFVTNVKTYQSRALVPGEGLWFAVFAGDYEQIAYPHLAWIDVVVSSEDCSTPPTPTPTPTATPSPVPNLVVYHVFLPLVIR
jgi:hypothetical protein